MSETPLDLYVLDATNTIWKCCPEYDNGMATRATTTGQVSAGIEGLRKEFGPLIEFTAAEVRHWIGLENYLRRAIGQEPR